MQPLIEMVREWVRKAEDDLRSAQVLLSASPPVLWAAAFHVQQSVEKFLKALLTFHRTEFEKFHEIDYLLDLAYAFEPQVERFRGTATKLTDYAVETRYPFPEQEPTEADVLAAIQIGREVREFVLERLPADIGK